VIEDDMNEAENMDNPEDPEDPKAKAKAAADAAAAIDRASEAIELSAAQAEAAEAAEAAEVAAEAAEAAEGAAAETPDELEPALGEVAALKDKLLRAMAETENLRRRSDREKTDTRKYAVADFARDMLAVSDNLQRALGSVSDEARKDNPDLVQLLEGVELTRKTLTGHFEKHGIKEINPLGEKLDPNFHQAVVQLDDPEAAQGTVVQVMQPGYVIHDRLLRAAMVGVAKGVPAQTEVKADVKSDGVDVPRDGQNVDTKA
jgi:molecular chaperone GrpE